MVFIDLTRGNAHKKPCTCKGCTFSFKPLMSPRKARQFDDWIDRKRAEMHQQPHVIDLTQENPDLEDSFPLIRPIQPETDDQLRHKICKLYHVPCFCADCDPEGAQVNFEKKPVTLSLDESDDDMDLDDFRKWIDDPMDGVDERDDPLPKFDAQAVFPKVKRSLSLKRKNRG